jgi:hypothetical protein
MVDNKHAYYANTPLRIAPMTTYTPEALTQLATFVPKEGLRQLLIDLNADFTSTVPLTPSKTPAIFLRHSADRQRDLNSVQLV